jgi:hypothetical protein
MGLGLHARQKVGRLQQTFAGSLPSGADGVLSVAPVHFTSQLPQYHSISPEKEQIYVALSFCGLPTRPSLFQLVSPHLSHHPCSLNQTFRSTTHFLLHSNIVE